MTIEDRRITTTLTLTDGNGEALADRDVTIRQRRHAFEFGCVGVGVATADEAHRAAWLDLFDTATLPVYWGRYEPERGHPRRDELRASAEWHAERGIRLKGHPLVWHTVKAPWVDELPLSEAEELLRARIRREVAEFAGLIDTWDVVNEAVIMPRFTNEPDGVPNAITRLCAQLGRVEMVRLAVDEARGVGTSPRLLVNDFDLGPEYERLIEDVLAAGIEIDAIGLQSHMHKGFRGEEQLLEVCERFARFGLPLHWTETTLVSGELMPRHIEDLNDFVVDDWPSNPEGEKRQAEEIVRHYTTLVGHPAVQSITYWGLGDGGWLSAPSGLLRADGSRKPAYHALHGLVRGEWWLAEAQDRTDHAGRVGLTGFAGEYVVTAGAMSAVVELNGAEREVVAVDDPLAIH